MIKCKVICLSTISALLILLSAIPVSADTNDNSESNLIKIPTSAYNETKILESEINLNINFLTSMLQMLDLNLHLISETLNAHLEEYPFLKPTLEGTDDGIKGVDSMLAAFGINSENLNDTNVTLSSLNETISQFNSNLEYPDGMIEDANSTMGESNITTPMIRDMSKSVKGMVSLLNQF